MNKISRAMFEGIIERLRTAGYADEDIAWAENLVPPETAEAFAREAIFVICNSGMRFTVAQQIFDRCCLALQKGQAIADVFRHPGKSAAIQRIWSERAALFAAYRQADDKLAFIADLPWIGGITKFHLAKNFGLDVVKPDVHLVRLAAVYGISPHELCAALSRETGYRVATIDTLLWRACAIGLIDSQTGRVSSAVIDRRHTAQ